MEENNKKILKDLGVLVVCFILLIVLSLIQYPTILKYPNAILLLIWVVAKSMLIVFAIYLIVIGIWIYLIYRKHKKSKRYKMDL